MLQEKGDPVYKNMVNKILSTKDEGELAGFEVDRIARDDNLLGHYVQTAESPYSKLIFVLTHRNITEQKAYVLWNKLTSHMEAMERLLGRKIGINVATLDYLENIAPQEHAFKIIDEASFEALIDFSTIDELTQLYNRDVFEVFIQKLFNESKRTNGVISYAMFDIDDFKKVNDTFGHQVGDKVLRSVGGIIKNNIREMDIAVRYGGEELGVIFPRIDEISSVAIVERIRKKIEEAFSKEWHITLSCGVADSRDKKDVAELIQAADRALYKAKQRGKNRVCLTEE